MFQETLAFRAKHGVFRLGLDDEDVKEIAAMKFWRLVGTSKENNPIQVTLMGEYNPALIKSEEAYLKFVIYSAELVAKDFAKQGWKSDKALYVYILFLFLS
jgi:hypothetical protein